MKVYELPILYQINARKQIYQWSVYVEEDDQGKIFLVTEHGVKDGNLVPHTKEITRGKGVGKAKKTIREQAIFEANSAWRDKKEKNGYSELSIEEGDGDGNGDVKGNIVISASPFYPMLANTFSWELLDKKKTKIAFPLYVQRKYDGIRCSAEFTNMEGVILKSRKGKKFDNLGHIREYLGMFFEFIYDNMPSIKDDIILDGELYTDLISFEEISGMVRQKKGFVENHEDYEKHMKIEYHIYDCYIKNRADMIFEQRWNFLLDMSHRYQQMANGSLEPRIRIVPTYMINSRDEIKQYHDQFVREGFEGIMLRSRDGVYEPKKRSAYLLKYKEFLEEEFEICGYHEGEGDDAGTVIWECRMNNGKEFSVKPKGTREQRRQMLENVGEYIWKKLTVIYQELTADGIPRFPVGKIIRDYE